jgi:hypothetical protein
LWEKGNVEEVLLERVGRPDFVPVNVKDIGDGLEKEKGNPDRLDELECKVLGGPMVDGGEEGFVEVFEKE